jgi:hypothetical protein
LSATVDTVHGEDRERARVTLELQAIPEQIQETTGGRIQ